MKPERRTVALTAITADPQAQPREETKAGTIAEYAEAMREGASFPPVVVFDDGEKLWLADGFHRLAAAAEAGLEEIEAEVRKGGLRDAVIFSCGVNATHGLQRTNDDKRRVVMRMLTDPLVSLDDKGNPWSDRKIAAICNVGADMVGRARRSLSPSDSDADPQPRAYTDRWGNTSLMNVSRIGKSDDPTAIQPGDGVPEFVLEENEQPTAEVISLGSFRLTAPPDDDGEEEPPDFDPNDVSQVARVTQLSIKHIVDLKIAPKDFWAFYQSKLFLDEVIEQVSVAIEVLTALKEESKNVRSSKAAAKKVR